MISAVNSSPLAAASTSASSSDPEKELMSHFSDVLSQLLSSADKLTQSVQATEQSVMKTAVEGEAAGEKLVTTSKPGVTYTTDASAPPISDVATQATGLTSSSSDPAQPAAHTHHSTKASHNYSKMMADRQSLNNLFDAIR